MKFMEKRKKKFTKKTLTLLKSCINYLRMIPESEIFKEEIDSIQDSFNCMDYYVNHPEVFRDLARKQMCLNHTKETSESYYLDFKRKYITEMRSFPIELLGSEIKTIIDIYKKEEANNEGTIFYKFESTYFTGTRKLNMNSYYMLVEKEYADKLNGVENTLHIIPVRLPQLCKRNYNNFPIVKFFDSDTSMKKLKPYVKYCGTGKDIKKLIFGQCNYFKEKEDSGVSLTNEEKMMFQVYINAYNEYFIDNEIDNDKIYKYFIYSYPPYPQYKNKYGETYLKLRIIGTR